MLSKTEATNLTADEEDELASQGTVFLGFVVDFSQVMVLLHFKASEPSVIGLTRYLIMNGIVSWF